MTLAEEWRPVVGFEGSYQVSDFGNVRSLTRRYTNKLGVKRKVAGKVLKPKAKSDGHVQVDLLGNMKSIHSLVMAAFVGPRPLNHDILHLNHCPADNRITNIRYGTRSENVKMDFAVGTRSVVGCSNPRSKLTPQQVLCIRESNLPASCVAEIHKVSRNTISDIRNFKTWTSVQNVADSSLVGKPTGDTQMAKAPKTMTPAEKKEALAGLKQAQKNHSENVKSISAALKEAEKALTVAKKSADAVIKEAEKEAAAKRKAADAALAAAAKSYGAAAAKAAKQQEAAVKGTEKLNAQLAAIEAIPVAAPVAAPKAKAAKAVEAALV